MILSENDLVFIQQCEEKYPEKGIRNNVTEFLMLDPKKRVPYAYEKMKSVYRHSYDQRGIPASEAETVFSNTMSIVNLAREITPQKNRNSLEKTIDIIWVHNIAKAIVPANLELDPETGLDANQKDLDKLDNLAAKLITEAYPAMMKNYEDYRNGSSVEARYCSQLQKLQDFKTASTYAATFQTAYVDDIVEQAENENWTSPTARSVFEKLQLKR